MGEIVCGRMPMTRSLPAALLTASLALAQLSTDAHAGLKSMGFIESGAYSIAIFATDIGLRYN